MLLINLNKELNEKKANLKALKDNNNEFMKAKKITSQNN